MDATERAALILDNDQDLYNSVRILAREWLRQHDRFAPLTSLEMALVDYDSGLGQEIREWVTQHGVSDGMTSAVVKDVLGGVDWGEIAKDLHNEIVEEMAERFPEWEIYIPEG